MLFSSDKFIISRAPGKKGRVLVAPVIPKGSGPNVSQRTWSPLQKEHLTRIEEAKDYARRAISDPVLNEYYAEKALRKKGIGAWHLAIKDYYHPPEILDAYFMAFTGKSGDIVQFTALDNLKVAATRVIFTSADGIVLDEGEGTGGVDNVFCKYVLKVDIELVPGLTVTIQATDLPGNMTSVELTWPFQCGSVIEFKRNYKGRKKRVKSQLRTRE